MLTSTHASVTGARLAGTVAPPMSRAPRVTAAVLTYDGRHLLEILLPSLAAQTLGEELRTVVVDNGSSDGTAQWLAAEWPQVEVVRFEENIGVTAALDVCLRAGEGSEHVAVLNNDLELDPACLAELLAALDAHPEAGSAAAARPGRPGRARGRC